MIMTDHQEGVGLIDRNIPEVLKYITLLYIRRGV